MTQQLSSSSNPPWLTAHHAIHVQATSKENELFVSQCADPNYFAFETHNELFARLMNILAWIFPCSGRGYAAIQVEPTKIYYVKRSDLQNAFGLDDEDAICEDEGLNNLIELQSVAYSYFKNQPIIESRKAILI